MLYETHEKQGCDNVASQIDQMTGWTYDKEADWLKGNRNYDQLKQQLAISEKALELACERVKYFEEMQDKEMGFYEFFGYDSDYDLKAIIEQYKQQAKEILDNE